MSHPFFGANKVCYIEVTEVTPLRPKKKILLRLSKTFFFVIKAHHPSRSITFESLRPHTTARPLPPMLPRVLPSAAACEEARVGSALPAGASAAHRPPTPLAADPPNAGEQGVLLGARPPPLQRSERALDGRCVTGVAMRDLCSVGSSCTWRLPS